MSAIVEQVKKALFCKHVFDSIPAKTPKVLLLTCRDCGLNVTANVEAYKLDKEETLDA